MKHEYYTTSDFCLASTLVSKGFQVCGVDRSNPQRISFKFTNNQDLQNLVANFWDKQVFVSPIDFYYSQKQLKNIIYQGGSK